MPLRAAQTSKEIDQLEQRVQRLESDVPPAFEIAASRRASSRPGSTKLRSGSRVTLEGLYDNDDCPWDDPTFDVSSEQNGTLPPTGNSKAQEEHRGSVRRGSGEVTTEPVGGPLLTGITLFYGTGTFLPRTSLDIGGEETPPEPQVQRSSIPVNGHATHQLQASVNGGRMLQKLIAQPKSAMRSRPGMAEVAAVPCSTAPCHSLSRHSLQMSQRQGGSFVVSYPRGMTPLVAAPTAFHPRAASPGGAPGSPPVPHATLPLFAGVPAAQLQKASLRPGVPGVAPLALQAGSHVAVPQAVAMRVGPQEPQATQPAQGLPAGPKIPENVDQSTAPQPAVHAPSTVEAPAAVQGVQSSQVQVMHFHGDPEVRPPQAQGVSEQSQSLTLSQPAQSSCAMQRSSSHPPLEKVAVPLVPGVTPSMMQTPWDRRSPMSPMVLGREQTCPVSREKTEEDVAIPMRIPGSASASLPSWAVSAGRAAMNSRSTVQTVHPTPKSSQRLPYKSRGVVALAEPVAVESCTPVEPVAMEVTETPSPFGPSISSHAGNVQHVQPVQPNAAAVAEVGKAIRDWTEEDVAVFLTKLSTVPVDIIDVVHAHAISGAVLLSLTEEDLETLNIEKFGHRRLLLLAAQELRRVVQAERPAGDFTGMLSPTSSCSGTFSQHPSHPGPARRRVVGPLLGAQSVPVAGLPMALVPRSLVPGVAMSSQLLGAQVVRR